MPLSSDVREPNMAMVSKAIDLALDLWREKMRVKVSIHKAHFINTNPKVWAYFINIVYLSRSQEIVLTHVWLEWEGEQYLALHPERELPHRLVPQEPWETWIEFSRLPDGIHKDPYRCGRVKLSTGKILQSTQAKNVPRKGRVPGGPITTYPESRKWFP